MPGARRPGRASGRSAFGVTAVLALAGLAVGGCGLQVTRHAMLEHPPWYSGRVAAPGAGLILHLPVAWQESQWRREATLEPPDGPLARLLQDMNTYLDTLGLTSPFRGGARLGGAPDVYFGCAADISSKCLEPEDSEGPAERLFELYAVPPAGGWRRWAGAALDSVGAGGMLVLTLETTYYWPHQRNVSGDKVIELGTEHVAPLAWLTELDAPVTVLQITGALVDREGSVVRLGAEGLFAKPPGLLLSLIQAQAVIRDEEVELVRTLRREDLPGAPPVWQAALYSLVTGLTGAPRTMR